MQIGFLLAAGLITCSLAVSAQAFPGGLGQSGPLLSIVGSDNREPLAAAASPALTRKIGRLTSSTGLCTGTLVGPRHVLTAAHCLADKGVFKQDVYTFSPGYHEGAHLEEAQVVRAKMGTLNPAKDRNKDFAILELNRDLGIKYGYLRVQAKSAAQMQAAGATIAVAGYSADVENGEIASLHRGCKITSDSDGNFLHQCDTTAGASGGPMLAYRNGGISVVGVHIFGFVPTPGLSLIGGGHNGAVAASQFVDIVTAKIRK